MKIIDCEQGTETWHRARAGMPTASKLATIMSSPSGRAGTMPVRTKYLYQLAGEIITGDPNMDDFKSAAMERGNAMEAEARSAYSLISDHDVTLVGFVENDGLIKGRKLGASPDGLIPKKNGGVEIKTQTPHLLIPRLLSGEFPSEHVAQCQGLIWICELDWIEVAVYWPRMPLYRRIVKRDAMFIERAKIAVETFFEDLDDIVSKIKALGHA